MKTKTEVVHEISLLRRRFKRFDLTKSFKLIIPEILFYTKFLNENEPNLRERLYYLEQGICKIKKCYCGKKVNFAQNGFLREYCSTKCSAKCPVNSKTKKATKLKKYGDENYNNSSLNVANKRKVDPITGLSGMDIMIANVKKTKLKKYGDENYNNPEKNKETWSNKTLEELDNIKKKRIKTCFEKYGVEHPLQNAEVHAKVLKSLYQSKTYTFPSGRTENIQGYEDQILDELIKHFEEEDIICGKDLPEIWYHIENKKKRYFTDIYIKSHNLIIEVKSKYTLKADELKNKLKRQACLDAGYKFWFAVI